MLVVVGQDIVTEFEEIIDGVHITEAEWVNAGAVACGVACCHIVARLIGDNTADEG